MHKSRVKEKIRGKEPIFCAKTNLTDPSAVEIFGYLGFDCVWIDMEHGPTDYEKVRNQVRAAKMTGMDSMIRVPRGSYSDYIRPLEMDATGLMVPHVMTPEEAAQAVKWSFFSPKGLRPIDSGNSDGPFCMRPIADYVRYCNEEKFLVVQIEDREAVECADRITDVKGIDIFFIGTLDLSHSYGKPGDFNHPEFASGQKKIIDILKKKGKAWGMPCGLEEIPQYYSQGCLFFPVGSDTSTLASAFREKIKSIEKMGFAFKNPPGDS
ncbi:MAG: aldolase/citrate lyase family protein [Candidatus Omnitrophota bacterium]